MSCKPKLFAQHIIPPQETGIQLDVATQCVIPAGSGDPDTGMRMFRLDQRVNHINFLTRDFAVLPIVISKHDPIFL